VNDLADALAAQIRMAGLPEPVREHRFCERRFRFDLAWEDRMMAVEVQGGVWSQGQHVRGRGYQRDCEKLNTATLLGWRVFWVTGDMIHSGLALTWVEQALGISRNRKGEVTASPARGSDPE